MTCVPAFSKSIKSNIYKIHREIKDQQLKFIQKGTTGFTFCLAKRYSCLNVNTTMNLKISLKYLHRHCTKVTYHHYVWLLVCVYICLEKINNNIKYEYTNGMWLSMNKIVLSLLAMALRREMCTN